MALVSCPECNKEISSMTECCLNCGYPVKKYSSESIKKRKKYKKNLMIGFIFLFTIIIATSAVVFFINSDKIVKIGSPKSDIPLNDTVHVYGAEAQAEYEIEDGKVSKIIYTFVLEEENIYDLRYEYVEKIIRNVEKKHRIELYDELMIETFAHAVDKDNIWVRCSWNNILRSNWGLEIKLSDYSIYQ